MWFYTIQIFKVLVSRSSYQNNRPEESWSNIAFYSITSKQEATRSCAVRVNYVNQLRTEGQRRISGYTTGLKKQENTSCLQMNASWTRLQTSNDMATFINHSSKTQ